MKEIKKYIRAVFFAGLTFFLSGYVYADTGGPIKRLEPPLKLLATLSDKDPNQSIAVIKHLGFNTQGIYKALDKISGYQIVRIRRGRVTLLKDGKLSSLEFALGSDFDPIVAISDKERIVNRHALLKKVLGLYKAFAQAIPIPYIEAGKIMGFKIAKPKDDGLLEMAGLKEGDIATKVNGERIESIKKALEMYRRLRNEDKIDLEIIRGPTVQVLTYHIN